MAKKIEEQAAKNNEDSDSSSDSSSSISSISTVIFRNSSIIDLSTSPKKPSKPVKSFATYKSGISATSSKSGTLSASSKSGTSSPSSESVKSYASSKSGTLFASSKSGTLSASSKSGTSSASSKSGTSSAGSKSGKSSVSSKSGASSASSKSGTSSASSKSGTSSASSKTGTSSASSKPVTSSPSSKSVTSSPSSKSVKSSASSKSGKSSASSKSVTSSASSKPETPSASRKHGTVTASSKPRTSVTSIPGISASSIPGTSASNMPGTSYSSMPGTSDSSMPDSSASSMPDTTAIDMLRSLPRVSTARCRRHAPVASCKPSTSQGSDKNFCRLLESLCRIVPASLMGRDVTKSHKYALELAKAAAKTDGTPTIVIGNISLWSQATADDPEDPTMPTIDPVVQEQMKKLSEKLIAQQFQVKCTISSLSTIEIEKTHHGEGLLHIYEFTEKESPTKSVLFLMITAGTKIILSSTARACACVHLILDSPFTFHVTAPNENGRLTIFWITVTDTDLFEIVYDTLEHKIVKKCSSPSQLITTVLERLKESSEEEKTNKQS